jgi:hypothetical protein
MKGSRVLAVVLVLLMISAPWSLATAEPVLYTIEFVASGLSSGPQVVTPMADEPLVFAGVTDTATVAAIAQANLTELAQLIASLGYVAGLGFGIAAIVKFKEHKNNPVQHGFAIEVSFPSPLTVPAVRDGELVTLTIDSILNNTLVLRTRHVAGGL